MDPSRTTHIWTIEIPESLGDEAPKPKQVTSGDFSENDLAWSPDGARIYFTSTRVFEPYYDVREGALYFVPAAGGEITKLFTADVGVQAYTPSPDGKWIAFSGQPARPI
jgi:Tol biopolymer transport system component